MPLGTCTKAFGGMSIAETAEIFARSGLDCVELYFCQKELFGWKYNMCGYEPLPSASSIVSAVGVFRSYGINVCAFGIYNCLWQGSASDCADSLKMFREYCDAAVENGISTVTTHSGTVINTAGSQRGSRDIKKRAFDAFTPALAEAVKRRLTVAVECSPFDVFGGWSDFCELKEYVRSALGTSDMLKYIAVPSSSDSGVNNSDIAMYHLKDKKQGGTFYERFGDGDTDFSDFFRDIKNMPDTPIILEYVNSGNIEDTAKRVWGFMNR